MLQSTFIILLSLLAIATVTDAYSHKIPNWLTFPGIFAGISINLLTSISLSGLPQVGYFWFSVSGIVVGMVMFLPLYAIDKMGAGDVKLLAMVGAFAGPIVVLWAAAWTLMAGGILALVWTVHQLGLRSSIYRTIGTFSAMRISGSSFSSGAENSVMKSKMPYAAAIFIGSLIACLQSGIQ